MNPVERAARKVDAAQQRYRPTAFVFGVSKKYGDDNGVLVASLAHSAFVSLFPLLLVLVTVLGLAASVNPAFRRGCPQRGGQPGPADRASADRKRAPATPVQRDRADRGRGGPGLGRDRAGPGGPVHDGAGVEPARARPARLCAAAGPRDGVPRPARRRGDRHHAAGRPQHLRPEGRHLRRGRPRLAAAVVNMAMYLAAFRVLDPEGRTRPHARARGDHRRYRLDVLQILGTYLVHHFLHSASVYGVFATVLGLVAYIDLAVRSPCTPRRSTWCWPGGYGRGPSSSRRSPRRTGPAWRCRRCRTSGARNSTCRCPSTTTVSRDPAPASTPRTPEEIAPPAPAPLPEPAAPAPLPEPVAQHGRVRDGDQH